MAKLNDLIVTIGAKTSQFDKKLGQSMSKMRNFGRNTKKLGRGLSMGLTAPLAAIGATSFKIAADFEQSMAKVKAVSGATGQEFKSLEGNAKQLGASTRFTASEVSALQLEYAKLGFSASEITQVTQATLNLAQATGSDLAQSAEVAGATLRAFGMDASQTGKVTDVMAAAFSSSALDLESFQDSMKYVAPVAKAAGVSLEEATAMLGQLANNGIKGSQAGTSLRRILQEVAGTGLDFGTAMQKTADEVINLADAKDEVGRSASSAFLVIKEGMKDVDGLTESLKQSKGAAAGMAATMDDTADGAMMRMKSAIEGAQIEIGSALAPVMMELAAMVSRAANAFTSLSDKTKKYIVGGAAIVAALGPLMVILPGIIAGLTALTGPIGLVVLAVVGLGIAVVKFSDVIAPYITGVINWFIQLYNESDAVRILVGYVQTAFVQNFKNIFSAIKIVANGIGDIGKAMLQMLSLDFDGAGETIKKGFKNAFDGITQIAVDTSKAIRDGINKELQRDPIDLISNEATEQALSTLGGLLTMFNSTTGGGSTATDGGPRGKVKPLAPGQISTGIASPKLIGKSSTAVSELADGMKGVNEEFAMTIDFSRQVEGALVGMGVAIGGLIAGTMGISDVFAQAMAGLGGFLMDLGQQFIAAGVAATAFYASLVANPLLAVAAGVALVAAGAVIQGMQSKMEGGVPALAEGGLAFGPSLALVGDNRGASADPEVIAPLSKLQNMMGGGQNVVVTGKISGKDILLSSELSSIDRNRVRGF